MILLSGTNILCCFPRHFVLQLLNRQNEYLKYYETLGHIVEYCGEMALTSQVFNCLNVDILFTFLNDLF